MAWPILFGTLLVIGGVWGAFVGRRTWPQRLAAAGEIGCLAVLVMVAVALLRQFSGQAWAEGVATGFLSVAVYDLVRKLPELIRSTAAPDEERKGVGPRVRR